jgi:DNA-binding CsgD family transcriptional regulator
MMPPFGLKFILTYININSCLLMSSTKILAVADLTSPVSLAREFHEQFCGLLRRPALSEVEIILKVTEGLPNKEADRQLNISENTVKMLLHRFCEAPGGRNRTILANFALAYSDQLALS